MTNDAKPAVSDTVRADVRHCRSVLTVQHDGHGDPRPFIRLCEREEGHTGWHVGGNQAWPPETSVPNAQISGGIPSAESDCCAKD